MCQSRRRNFLDRQLVQCPREFAGQPHRLGRALAFLANEAGQEQLALQWIDGAGNFFAEVERIERSPDPFANVRVADCDQAWEDETAIARPDERLGYRSHRPIAGQQDPSPRQGIRPSSKSCDEAADKGIGEASVGRDRISERAA